MKKKLGIMFLVLSAILIIPFVAHAAEIIDSGTCGADGDNLTWTLDDGGTLTISGTGEMNNYGGVNGDLSPWCDNTENITKVVIEDGVTSVGEEAFLFCTNLWRAVLPDSVTYIGNSAFSACENLTDIKIPSGVTSIGELVFDGCAKLPSIDIPKSITSIGAGAFNGCRRLLDINIPSSVTSIGEFAFGGCGRLYIVVDADNPNYSSVNGVLFNKDKTELIAYSQDETHSEYTVPDGVESVGMDAFYGCSYLTNITIRKGVKNIERAFSYCGRLDITVDADNPNYSSVDGVLFNKDKTELIAYAKDRKQSKYTVPDGVTSIGADAFVYCENLKRITIKNGVRNIGDHAFYYCIGLTSLVIPNSVTSIGDSAFFYCTDLKSVTIPSSITSIGDGAFNYCDGLTDVYYSGSEEDWKKINIGSSNEALINAAIHYNKTVNIVDRGNCGADIIWMLEDNGTLTISGVGEMNDYDSVIGDVSPWYDDRESVTKVIVEGGVTRIGENAFYECSKLQETVFPDGIMSIGLGAFEGCTSLSRVTIPESVTSIDLRAFFGCTSLPNVAVPDSVTSIGFGAFAGCGSLDITVDANNPNYSSIDGVLFNKDMTELKAYAKDKKQPQYTVPDSVTSIGDEAFSECIGLTSINIPIGVTSIGRSAFEDCTGLPDIIIPDGVTSLGWHVFSGCTRLTSITIPDSVTSIDYGAFKNCSSLANINISDNVSVIKNGVFDGCGNLNITVGANNPYYSSIDGVLFNKDKTVLLRYAKDKIQCDYSVPTGVTSIGDDAFDGCTGLTNVIIPDSVMSIGDGAFDGCTGLTSVIIPDNVTSIGDYSFLGCQSLTKIIIPDSVTSIGETAFGSCESLADIYYGGSKTEWQNAIGEGNWFLTDVVIHYNSDGISPDRGECGAGGANLTWTLDSEGTLTISGTGGMKDFGYDNYPSWYDLKKRIKKVIIEAGVTSIGEQAFYHYDSLTSINIPDSITSIGEEAFANCTNLISIDVPAGVTSISDRAFSGCGSLNIVVSPQNNTYSSVDGVLFNKDKTQILAYSKDVIQTAYTIPDSVTSIGDYAFYDCGGLTSIDIPDNVTSIGDYAFYYCTKLANITISDNLESIGEGAFEDTRYYQINDNWSEGVLYIGHHLIYAISKEISAVYNIKSGTKCIADDAFSFCEGLTCVTIPNSVTSIGVSSFYDCSGLKSIIIPNGVKNIGDYAFYQCSGLTSVTIPSSVISIGDSAFKHCNGLKDIYYSGSVEQWYNIVVEKNNDCLNGAEIHFNEIHFSDGKIEGSVNFDLNKNVIAVSASLDNLAAEEREKSEVFVVLYDENDVVIDSYNAVYEGAEISGTLKSDEKADHIKVFVWNRDGSLEPITDVPEVIDVSDVTSPPDPAEILGIAFITNIGAENDSLKVDYYQDGVLKTALTSPDFNDPDITRDTQPGTLVNLKISDGLIVSAEPYISFLGSEILSDITAGGYNPGVPKIAAMRNASFGEEVYFGAIVGKEGGSLYIAPMTPIDALPDFMKVHAVSIENKETICYVYNSAKAANERCGTGSVDEITIDPNLAGDMGVSTGHIINYGSFSGLNPVPEMLDYAYVLIKKGLKSEVVVYKQRPYDYEVVM